ncbi:hypothetical protein TYRP_002299 [Tyrophagus putrescentiae]|nr:hypothetical protein TYRP_002299 [Tyrophagus putrescentiae]
MTAAGRKTRAAARAADAAHQLAEANRVAQLNVQRPLGVVRHVEVLKANVPVHKVLAEEVVERPGEVVGRLHQQPHGQLRVAAEEVRQGGAAQLGKDRKGAHDNAATVDDAAVLQVDPPLNLREEVAHRRLRDELLDGHLLLAALDVAVADAEEAVLGGGQLRPLDVLCGNHRQLPIAFASAKAAHILGGGPPQVHPDAVGLVEETDAKERKVRPTEAKDERHVLARVIAELGQLLTGELLVDGAVGGDALQAVDPGRGKVSADVKVLALAEAVVASEEGDKGAHLRPTLEGDGVGGAVDVRHLDAVAVVALQQGDAEEDVRLEVVLVVPGHHLLRPDLVGEELAAGGRVEARIVVEHLEGLVVVVVGDGVHELADVAAADVVAGVAFVVRVHEAVLHLLLDGEDQLDEGPLHALRQAVRADVLHRPLDVGLIHRLLPLDDLLQLVLQGDAVDVRVEARLEPLLREGLEVISNLVERVQAVIRCQPEVRLGMVQREEVKTDRVDAQHRGDDLEDEVFHHLDGFILADALLKGAAIEKIEDTD